MRREKRAKWVFLLLAWMSVGAVGLILCYLLGSGIPTILEIGPNNFFGTVWKPSEGLYGIRSMLAGSACVTLGAMLVGVPLGLLCALYLSRFCPRSIYRSLRWGVSLLAGIPSIVYGFFGLTVLVPLLGRWTDTGGKGLLTASLLLGVMTLPTIISVAESALSAVPESYYEGALALGATHEKGVFSVVLPAAGSGVLSAVILGAGRAVGETMAVMMVAGNQALMPRGLLAGLRTMTTAIVLEMGYASGLHRQALIAIGAVLLVLILILCGVVSLLKGRGVK
jgi:phosphate transport system permease protein